MAKLLNRGATIPYQLRPRKAIERNIFVDLLKKIASYDKINFTDYRYVGFGAAYLEDFKQMHLELGIVAMDCIEMDKHAYSRQLFNNPYYFVNSYNISSTDYIDTDFKFDRNQIVWLDYTMPRYFRQQLTDVETLCSKLVSLDIIKFTFNSQLRSFISSQSIKKDKYRLCQETDLKFILQFLKDDETYKKYLPEEVGVSNLLNFDTVIRALAVRAINRGLTLGGKNIKFHHLTSFTYADGQEMTTITGVVCTDEEFSKIIDQCKLESWPFLKELSESESEFVEAIEIAVPDMTVSERIEIDKRIPAVDINAVAKELIFYYGSNDDEHIN